MMGALEPATPMLVIDDSKAIRAVMDSYLRRLGYQNVHAAASVEEGLRLFRETNAEVVFLDVILGNDEAGIDFAQRALDERPLTTIVLLTALRSDDEMVTHLVSQGARHMIVKPVQLSALRTVLGRIQETRDEEAGLPAPQTDGTTTHTAGYQ